MPRYNVRVCAHVDDVLITWVQVEAENRNDAAERAIHEVKNSDADWSVNTCGSPYDHEVDIIEEEE